MHNLIAAKAFELVKTELVKAELVKAMSNEGTSQRIDLSEAALERFPIGWNRPIDMKSLQNQKTGATSHPKSLSTFSELALNAFFARKLGRPSYLVNRSLVAGAENAID